MNYKEVEFKYNAKEISLKAFRDFCDSLKETPVKFIEAAGYDHFYDNSKEAGAFFRHRIGPNFNQLTFKRKILDANSYVRTEYNLDLSEKTSKRDIEGLVKETGYKHNFSLFKVCFVYFYERYVLSYYVVYNENLEEAGRFIEIEANEAYAWKNEEEALDTIVVMEKVFKGLGLSSQMRFKKNLFEMFKK